MFGSLTGRAGRMAFVAAITVSAATGAWAQRAGNWVDAFQSSPASYDPLPAGFAEQMAKQYNVPAKLIETMTTPKPASGTVRVRFAVSVGGTQLRIRLSNEEGSKPLRVSAASLGLAGKGYSALPGSLRVVTFNGHASVSIPAGAPVVSDPIDLATAPGTDLMASVMLTDSRDFDPRGGGMMAVAAGDQTRSETLTGDKRISGRPLVTGAQVLSNAAVKVIVTLGDSITDGNRTDPAVLRGWPGELAQRLAARRGGTRYAVVNAGIGGNRLLAGGWGPAALARFDRDVLRINGVSHVVILEGTNDIGMSGPPPFGDGGVVMATELIDGYRQLIERAHARGIRVVLGTILPFGGSASHFSPAKEAIRQSVNHWIRTSRAADAIVDFDAVGRDPARPAYMRKEFASTDNLHPGDAGYKAMGDAIDLGLFH